MEGLDYLAADFLGASVPDPKVRAAQAALTAAGFDTKGVDGLFGPNTEKAIAAFWASKGQSHAAVVDDDLTSALSSVSTPAPAPPKTTAIVKASDAPAPSDEPAAPSRSKRILVLAGGVLVTLGAVGVLYYAGDRR